MSDIGPDLLAAMYVLIGVLLALTGMRALLDRTNPRRWTTGAFWLLLAFAFAFGPVVPAWVIGVTVLLIGALSLAKGVKVGTLQEGTDEEKEAGARRLGSWLFLPALSLAGIAVVIATWAPFGDVSGTLSIGVASILALLIAWAMTKAPAKVVLGQSDRLIQQVGPVGMLPQFLAMLGVVFTAAGVGTVVADLIAGVVPEGNKFAGVLAYCIGMAVFTAVVGNAFAAYATAYGLTSGGVGLVPITIGFFLSGDVFDNPHLGQALAFGMFVVLGLMMLAYIPLQRISSRWMK